jgi:AcrR family transcriptional regulator
VGRVGDQEARTAPGPKPALTVDAIVNAAIAVADADAMDGLSLRAVGERLGRTAMALYTYVPTKRELIDLMYDQAHAEMPTEHDHGTGLEPSEVRPVVSALFSLVRGAARSVAEARAAAGTTGTTDTEWWTVRSRLMQELVPDFAQRFPLSTRLSQQTPPPPSSSSDPTTHWEREAQEAFTTGRSILLDGVALMARRRSP